jgi:hypothetical protein
MRAKSPQINQDKKVWRRPLSNVIKLNIDATFSVDNQLGATGAALQNNQGVFLGASTTFIPHVPSASMAEALAMLRRRTLANSLGYTNIEAESDSLEVVNLWSGADTI